MAVILPDGKTNTQDPNPRPVPRFRHYHIHADHLNTPRAILDTANRTVWRWDNSDAFGNGSPQEDPDHDGKRFTYNLRFPGQYFDTETGLHYNMSRYYSPRLGRYIQSDRIGLAGGLNTYSYVGGNPVNRIDPLGLIFIDPTGTIPDDTTGLGEVRGPANDPCGCLQKALGLDSVLGTGLVLGGQPVYTKRFVQQGSSIATSPISKGLSDLFPQRLPFRCPAPTSNNPFAKSNIIGRILGRWAPFVGWGMLSFDIYQYSNCISQCEENVCNQCS